MIKNLILSLTLIICFTLPNITFAQSEKNKKSKQEKKIEEIYRFETSYIDSLPNAYEFHKRYEKYLKESIKTQLKLRWAEAMSAFGTGVQGDTYDHNASRSNKLKNERTKIYEDWINKIETGIINIPDKNTSKSGTGFAISVDGLIVTNYHVVGEGNRIIVRGIDGDFNVGFLAKKVIEDKNNDLAIIQIIDNSFKDFGNIPYSLKQSSSDVGEDVFVLGYPLTATMGDEIKLTNGIISSKTGFQNDVTSYQISAPVQPGNSGGPLFDASGYLIGIINAKHLEAENATYAVKVNYLLNLLDLIDNQSSLPEVNDLSGKTLKEQVAIIKNFVFLIQVD
ncbi:MAG: S1C family serine protease [Draconibacterium sp.]